MNKNERFTQIAREQLGIETLESRGRDALDFHEVGVAGLSAALEAAYRAGQATLLKAAEGLLDARENQMVTVTEWNALRRAVKAAKKNT